MLNTAMIKIHHNKNFIEYGLTRDINNLELQCVAEVDTDDLDDAFAQTQNINWPWPQNEAVKTRLQQCRSTSIGDVLEKDGSHYVVDIVGFTKIELSQHVS